LGVRRHSGREDVHRRCRRRDPEQGRCWGVTLLVSGGVKVAK
jgi:hypothetical protein